ncbi:Succinoglycan biosynthesis protein ExoV [Neorhizobium galegae bv. officinalis bv. officinalis str. HAMBI 1141]|uniref:Succinoglycan biosynthesis protein ExoV n=1 Tax=Neorhizobium galegae bv. officinalis bv. officinalis str. HAMBI 1141 TaxID=1028801 RepID=A0A068TC45_NEOGA|nr:MULTISPECIES: polysaccharide pyruvyl transferase family protein [Neorhizobium]MCJ9670464.1 polysaccharide pyruvyl transferase family protein [Neorhizobium sp. SHOUNA12B]MCJ9744331.1 polysaccharide pyruvyl transferase family protein [Neorhizobium sp. SHOUNA12A]CDN55689.1 Succinoglycan biosynthesis protein ExoV [Neorhizobium galegae bv. officinalis bv. officinalis str. HAMBI 1141]
MKAYYWESHHGNFGDDLNLWLWDALLPGFRDVHPEVLLVGVGTVLNPVLLPVGQKKLVIGSGYGYGTPPDVTDAAEWDVRTVRGPMTAAKLGISTDKAITDPAVMIADMPEFQNLPKIHRKTFIPHWESAEFGMWNAVCEPVGLTYLDPRGEAKSVIRHIAQSELIIAESMHGAILADAFRVPWVAVSSSRSINNFKWNDWAKSVGTTYEPRYVPVSTRAEAVAKRSRFWGISFDGQEQPSQAAYDTHGGEVMTHPAPSQSGLRGMAKQFLAAPSVLALWQASRAEPRLSPVEVLEERKEKFRAMLEGIRRDYF